MCDQTSKGYTRYKCDSSATQAWVMLLTSKNTSQETDSLLDQRGDFLPDWNRKSDLKIIWSQSLAQEVAAMQQL